MSNPYQDLDSDYSIGAIHGYIQHVAIIHHISFELQLVDPNQNVILNQKFSSLIAVVLVNSDVQ